MKILAVIDEYTRESLATHVARSITAPNATDILATVMLELGTPGLIRSDNSPEPVATAVTKWLESMAQERSSWSPVRPGRTGTPSPLPAGCGRNSSTEKSLLSWPRCATWWRLECRVQCQQAAQRFEFPYSEAAAVGSSQIFWLS